MRKLGVTLVAAFPILVSLSPSAVLAGDLRSSFQAAPGVPGTAPAVSGSRIVWQAWSGTSWDVMMRDGAGTVTTVAGGPADEIAPAIDGLRVVWQDARSGTWDVYMRDLAGGTEALIAGGPGDQAAPSISGSRVVWQDSRNGNWDVFMRDLGDDSLSPVVLEEHDQTAPKISGPRIVWEDGRFGNPDVYFKDLDTGCESAAVVHPSVQRAPAISGDRIVWSDERTGVPTIRMLEVATQAETEVAPSGTRQRTPAIIGTRVAWSEDAAGVPSVRLVDVAAGTDLTFGSGSEQSVVALSASHLAWEQQDRSEPGVWWSETVAPAVTLTRPVRGATVQEAEAPVAAAAVPRVVAGTTISLEAAASDAESSVATVTFLVDGEQVCVSGAPFRCEWTVVPGLHTIAAVALDAAGNSRTASAEVLAV